MKENVKTNLIYFGTLENSKYGTLRSLIAITLLFIILSIMYVVSSFYKKIIKERILGIIILCIALVSALCVIVPQDEYDAIKYGGSIGAFFSIIVIVSYSEILDWNSLIFLISSILLGMLISFTVYKISKKLDWYPVKPCL